MAMVEQKTVTETTMVPGEATASTLDQETQAFFSQLYERYAGVTFAHAFYLVRGNPTEAEDVTQEAFLATLENVALRGATIHESTAAALLRRIASRIVWHSQHDKQLSSVSLDAVTGYGEMALSSTIADPNSSLFTECIANREVIAAALGMMSIADQECLGMSVSGFEQKHIAELLGIKRSTYSLRLMRARNRLRARLTDLGE